MARKSFNVPVAKGVPPINRSVQAPAAGGQTTAPGVGTTPLDTQTQQWGIFLNGAPVITADTVAAFDYKKDFNLPDYPIEPNSFESYNKVETPFDVRVRFSTGGSLTDKQNFINSMDAACASTQLYDVVTPEKTYTSVNLDHADYHRAVDSGGPGLLIAEVWGLQIRLTATQAFTQTKAPAGSAPQSTGQVQPGQPTTSQKQTVQQHGASGSW